MGIIEFKLLKNKALFHTSVWLEIIFLIVLFRWELFFRQCGGIQCFNLLRQQSKSLICRERKVTENKLKSSDYEFNILYPVIFKTNFSSAIHQSKTFVTVVVITFYVSSLMVVKQQWGAGIMYMSAAYVIIDNSGRLG